MADEGTIGADRPARRCPRPAGIGRRIELPVLVPVVHNAPDPALLAVMPNPTIDAGVPARSTAVAALPSLALLAGRTGRASDGGRRLSATRSSAQPDRDDVGETDRLLSGDLGLNYGVEQLKALPFSVEIDA